MPINIKHSELNEPVTKHMRRETTSLSSDWTVQRVLEWLRKQDLAERILYFYAVDSDGILVGVVPARKLLMSRPEEIIADIMDSRVISIPEGMTVVDACEFFVMYRMLAFPVVDADKRLLGVIDASLFTDEVFNLSRSRAEEDIFQLIGVHILRGRKGSPWTGFRSRFPWLLCNIIGGILCALLAGRYEAFLDSAIVLALFIPVVLALSESVSIQTMSLTLQEMYGSTVDWKNLLVSLGREFLTAVLLGAASGSLVAGVAFLWKRQPSVAAAIGGSIAMSIVTACLLGVLLPMLIRILRGNPRIAAGPMVLALSDVLTLLFYFNLSAKLLN